MTEQLEIVKVVETVETWIISIEEVVARTLRRADHLRSSILAAAFSGKLVPQDPNDEPASVVLERIEAEEHEVNGHKPTRTRKPRAPQEKVTL